jgi:DNA repair protein RecO (recombination protein O)
VKQFVDKAVVLRRTDLGERDRILTVLTSEHGKISLLAKGVRSEKSRLAAGIELLSISDITFVESKSNLYVLSGARLVTHYGNIVSDLTRVNQIFEMYKLINKLSEDEAGQEYFSIISAVLTALNDKKSDPRLVEIWFGLHILHLAGSLSEIKSSGVDKNARYQFDYEQQKFVVSPEGPFSYNDLKLMKLSLIQPKPIKLQNPIGSEDQLVTLVRLLKRINIEA